MERRGVGKSNLGARFRPGVDRWSAEFMENHPVAAGRLHCLPLDLAHFWINTVPKIVLGNSNVQGMGRFLADFMHGSESKGDHRFKARTFYVIPLSNRTENQGCVNGAPCQRPNMIQLLG